MKFKVIIAIAVVTLPSAFAQKPSEQDIATADNACALFATEMVTGMRSRVMNRETALRLCNSHPVAGRCSSTRKFIEESGKDMPPDALKAMALLTCDGSPAK